MLLRNTENKNKIDTRVLFGYEDLTGNRAQSGVSCPDLVSDILSAQISQTFDDYRAHVEVQSTKMTLSYVKRLQKMAKDSLEYVSLETRLQ